MHKQQSLLWKNRQCQQSHYKFQMWNAAGRYLRTGNKRRSMKFQSISKWLITNRISIIFYGMASSGRSHRDRNFNQR